jgi:hypothetical protein
MLLIADFWGREGSASCQKLQPNLTGKPVVFQLAKPDSCNKAYTVDQVEKFHISCGTSIVKCKSPSAWKSSLSPLGWSNDERLYISFISSTEGRFTCKQERKI